MEYVTLTTEPIWWQHTIYFPTKLNKPIHLFDFVTILLHNLLQCF